MRLILLTAIFSTSALAGDVVFQHHFIDKTLPQKGLLGDYGLTALVDIDKDGDLDFVCGGRQPGPDRLYWFEYQGPDKWVRLARRHLVREQGRQGAEMGGAQNIPMGRKGPFGICVRTALADMDGNGKPVIVMSDADITDSKLVILRTADKGRTCTKQELPQSFKYGSLHSLAVADLNGDGRPDIVSNEQEELLPDGRQNPRWVWWENLGDGKYAEHILLDAKLGGHELQVGDVDGDGDIDIVSKAWGCMRWNALDGTMHVDYLENRTKSIK